MILLRVKNYGPPRQVYVLSDKKLAARFWSKVNKQGGGGCWLWTARTSPYGYVEFQFNRKTIAAHRMSMMFYLGRELYRNENVLHDCPEGDNPACVNPKHLWLGSKAENSWDMVEKGRSRGGGGMRLDESDIQKMRWLYESGMTVRALSKRFGVSFTWTWAIVANKARKI